jgi:hypothetical protein
MAKEQDTPWVQSLVEHFDSGFPGTGVKVNQHITAKDDVGTTENARSVLIQQVHLAEVTKLTNGVYHVPAVQPLLEALAAYVVGGRAKATFRVNAATRGSHAAAGDV